MSGFSLDLPTTKESSGGFSLDLPDTEAIKKEVAAELAPTPEEKTVITNVVKDKADQIMAVDLDSLAQRREFVQVIETFGSDLVRQSQTKNSILQKRMGDFSRAGGESGEVARGLEDLSIKMRDLDPSGLDFTKTGVLGKVFNPIRRYFERFKTADAEIAGIVKTLENGRTVLKNDNTTLEIEQAAMRDLTKQLTQKIELGSQLDFPAPAKADGFPAITGGEPAGNHRYGSDTEEQSGTDPRRRSGADGDGRSPSCGGDGCRRFV